MNVRASLGIVAVLSLVQIGEAQANASPFPLQDAQPKLCFVNLADYPEYIFYLQYHCSDDDPYTGPLHIIRLSSGVAVTLDVEGRNFSRLVLVAMPRGAPAPSKDYVTHVEDAEELPTPCPCFVPGWLDGSTVRVDPVDSPVTSYRVSIQDGYLDLTELPKKFVPPIRNILVVAALSLTIIAVWLSFIRRRRTNLASSNTTPEVIHP
jgi:hypothetical protein